MDIFKQNRYLIITVILLVVLNLGTLYMLWMGRPHQPIILPGHRGPEQINRMLKVELGFDDQQVEKYIRLRDNHHRQMMQNTSEIRKIKKQMFDVVLQENPHPVLSDSLLKLSQEKQAKIEQLTFQYLLDLKKMCTPEQKKKLRLLMHELFRQQPAGMRDGPPPPLEEGLE